MRARKARSTRERAFGLLGADIGAREAGPDDVDAVEPGLGVDLLGVALPAHPVIPDLDVEVLTHLPAVGLFADCGVDAVAVVRSGLSPPRTCGNLGERGLGARKQILALSRPFLTETRVQADHQALAGEVRAGDLGDLIGHQVLRTKRRLGILPGVSRDEKLSDPGRLQCRDPVEPGGLDVLTDARGGEHAPISDERDPLDAKGLAELEHLSAHRGRIADIAGEDLDGQRASVGVAEKYPCLIGQDWSLQ